MAVVRLKDVAFKVVTKVHETVFRATKGRVLGRAGGMPVVILTTTGRKSGQKRSTVLTAPVLDDERIVLVASFGGDDRHPAWFRNLDDDPDVRVLVGGRERAMRARLATAQEADELWPLVISAYRGYATYRARTDRDIPLVVLEPVIPSPGQP